MFQENMFQENKEHVQRTCSKGTCSKRTENMFQENREHVPREHVPGEHRKNITQAHRGAIIIKITLKIIKNMEPNRQDFHTPPWPPKTQSPLWCNITLKLKKNSDPGFTNYF